MKINNFTPQLRTVNMASTIRFYTEKLGFTIQFQYEDLYAGLRCGDQMLHLKYVCDLDPSIQYVDEGGHLHIYFGIDDAAGFAEDLKSKGVALVKDVHDTDWQTREFVINDDQGHTLYFGQVL